MTVCDTLSDHHDGLPSTGSWVTGVSTDVSPHHNTGRMKATQNIASQNYGDDRMTLHIWIIPEDRRQCYWSLRYRYSE